MRSFVVRRSAIDRCPKRSLSPGHYLEDGRCGCVVDPSLALREHTLALVAWIEARGDRIPVAHERLVAARAALVVALADVAKVGDW